MNTKDLQLYLVTDRDLLRGRDLQDVVLEAVAGGVTMVQLREKHTCTRDFVALAQQLKSLLAPKHIPLVINDRIDVALAVDADGVHIGQSDMPYAIARQLLGKDKIIGLSVENFDDIRVANQLDVDYVGVSPVFATPTKNDTASPFGLEGLREAVKLSVHPTVAIGGMNESTVGDVMRCGTDGVAVVSAIVAADDPRMASARLCQIIQSNTKNEMGMTWSKAVWEQSLPIFNAITNHPFIIELANGSLDAARFNRYLGQDEVYIGNYGRQMFQLADRISNPEEREMFRLFAQSGIDSEKAMHQLLISRFGTDAEVKASVVTAYYNAHTQHSVDHEPVEVALAAMLPCMWIYNRVGLHILSIANLEGNPYREWIEEYGNEEFTEGVNSVVALLDRWADRVSPDVCQRMTQVYAEAALFEYAFWDYGYYAEDKNYEYIKKGLPV